MLYIATLQDAFFITAIVFMVVNLLLIVGGVIAVFVIKARIKKKVDRATLLPRRAFAFWSTFVRGMK